MKWLSVGVFGLFGGLTRLLVTGTPHSAWDTVMTVLINLAGAFALGYLNSADFTRRWPKWLKIGISTGFIGSFTTFSGFLNDVLAWSHSSIWTGAGVFCLTVFGGFAAAHSGVTLGLWTNNRRQAVNAQQSPRGNAKELIS